MLLSQAATIIQNVTPQETYLSARLTSDFLQARCPSWSPTNNVKVPKESLTDHIMLEMRKYEEIWCHCCMMYLLSTNRPTVYLLMWMQYVDTITTGTREICHTAQLQSTPNVSSSLRLITIHTCLKHMKFNFTVQCWQSISTSGPKHYQHDNEWWHPNVNCVDEWTERQTKNDKHCHGKQICYLFFSQKITDHKVSKISQQYKNN